MDVPIIAVIGAGNMGSSLVGGLINNGQPADKLWVSDPNIEKLEQIKQAFHTLTTTDNIKAAQAASVIIFAIKPHHFAEVAKTLQHTAHAHKPMFISIAAGIREKSIQRWLGGNAAIVRAMPNTPALIGCGATGLFANSLVSSEQRSTAESILRAVGLTVWVDDENLLDVVTALSGSGPAYFFHLMEALQLAAEELGLPNETARLLTLQTALGAARMALESGKPLSELRHNVTSPGGTTEKAISVLEEHNVHRIYKKAIHAAKLRSEELAELLGENK